MAGKQKNLPLSLLERKSEKASKRKRAREREQEKASESKRKTAREREREQEQENGNGNSFPLVSVDTMQSEVNIETPLPMWPCHIGTRPILTFIACLKLAKVGHNVIFRAQSMFLKKNTKDK